MGLSEQLRAGANLTRDIVSFIANSSVGSASLGATFALTNIQVSSPCRIRLYDNSASLADTTETNRQFNNLSISNSIALLGDFTMSAETTEYSIDPVLYGHSENATEPLTWYRIENTTFPVTVRATRYLMDDLNVTPNMATEYTTANRRTLPTITQTLTAGQSASGVLKDVSIPQTFLLVSASLSNAAHTARVRLYNNSASLSNTTEITRPFYIEPTRNVGLLVDMNLSGSNPVYFVPKIFCVNLENIGTDLREAKGDSAKISGNDELYYIITNTGISSATISVSLHAYSLEESENIL